MEMCSILQIGALSQNLKPDVRFAFDRHGKLVGYTSQHNRHLPETDATVHFAIKRVAIETFQKEGPKVSISGFRRSPTPGMMRSSNKQALDRRITWTGPSRAACSIASYLRNRGLEIYRGVPAAEQASEPGACPQRILIFIDQFQVVYSSRNVANCEPPSEGQPPQFIVCLIL